MKKPQGMRTPEQYLHEFHSVEAHLKDNEGKVFLKTRQ